MKDPLSELIKAYVTALSGVLNVYDGQAPDNSQDNYIVITDAVVVPQQDKSNFFNEIVTTFQIVSKGFNTGFKVNTTYVNQFLGIINQDTVLTMTNFTMDNQVIEDIQRFDSLTDKEKVFRRVIRVRSFLTEK